MIVLESASSALCAASGLLAVCGAFLGGILGYFGYKVYHKYVTHTAGTETGAQWAAIKGAIEGAIGGAFSRIFANRIMKYIFGYQGRHVVVTIGSKLYKMGWGFAGDMLNKAYWAFADYLSKKWS